MKIAAFNVRNLGMSKVNNDVVLKNLIKIVSQYSVVVMLEVMDTTGRAMKKFLRELNNYEDNEYDPYAMKSSELLGRSWYREKFVYFYRESEVELVDFYQYEEEDNVDVFAREPYIIRIRCPHTVVGNLALIPVHTTPEDAETELDALVDVVKDVKERWGTNNIMILGDFNADGRYLSKKKKGEIRIHSAPYHWLIDDDVDTTSSNKNDNTYDRIVVYGQTMLDAIVPSSAKSFNFQKAFKLTDEQTLSISDHYPVEVELKTGQKQKAPRQKRTETKSTKGQTQRKGNCCLTLLCLYDTVFFFAYFSFVQCHSNTNRTTEEEGEHNRITEEDCDNEKKERRDIKHTGQEKTFGQMKQPDC
uniref:Deoxyribonuclease 1 like 4, tandem duplicate 2 n=1 Tax=Lates calcarifer TaxID=8187 RepID=A0A4W6DCI5_LATCA